MSLQVPIPQFDEYRWPSKLSEFDVKTKKETILDYAHALSECEELFLDLKVSAKDVRNYADQWKTLPDPLQSLNQLKQDIEESIEISLQTPIHSDLERQVGKALSRLHRFVTEYAFIGNELKNFKYSEELYLRFDILGEQLFSHWSEFMYSLPNKS